MVEGQARRVAFYLLCRLILLAGLAGPVWAQNIRIQDKRFEGRYLVRKGYVYVLLEPFSQALGARLGQAGEGYWSALSGGEGVEAVPAGVVQVGSRQVPLLLESGDVFVPAEAFSQALGLSTRYDAGGGLRIEPAQSGQVASRPRVPDDPSTFFVTQYPSRYNQWASNGNSNCGPACMAMVALAYGVTPQGLVAGDRQGLVLWCRQTMTLNSDNQKRGTTPHEIERMATQLGLKSHLIRRFQDLDAALAQGQLVIVGGDTARIGWGGGDHFLLCLGRRGADYIINDPGGFCRTPGTHMADDLMEKFFSEAVALFP
jgi:hypothetical protein